MKLMTVATTLIGGNASIRSSIPIEGIILHELQKERLIEHPRRPIDFLPRERGVWYRKLRAHASKHTLGYALGGLAATLATGGYVFGSIKAAITAAAATGIGGAIGIAAGIGRPLDAFFLANPNDVAPRLFIATATHHPNNTYRRTNASSKGDLDSLAYIARNASAVATQYPDVLDKARLGIMMGKAADLLAAIHGGKRGLERRVRGLKERDVVRIVRSQELMGEHERRLLRLANEKELSDKQLVRMMRRLRRYERRGNRIRETRYRQRLQDQGLYDIVHMMRECVENFEFRLTIEGGDKLHYIGTELSAGLLRVQTSTGYKAGFCLGDHASGTDFPRIVVGENVGSEFLSCARRGLGVVGNNALNEVLAGAKGGMAVIRGTTGNRFGFDMDDEEAPAMGVVYGGILDTPKPGDIKNGLVITLNRNIDFRRLPPMVYLFEDGKRIDKDIDTDGLVSVEMQMGAAIRSYVDGWIIRRYRKFNEQYRSNAS